MQRYFESCLSEAQRLNLRLHDEELLYLLRRGFVADCSPDLSMRDTWAYSDHSCRDGPIA
ncbi:MAG: hypothetical protein LUD00_01465 [Prevotellaceae bacterium]|nr:hypothetical protein [Prevotellaceae bacterium]